MTDLPNLWTDAEKVARELGENAESADNLHDDLVEAEAEANPAHYREPDEIQAALAEAHRALIQARDTVRMLASRLDDLTRNADSVSITLDDYRYDFDRQQDIAAMALDVERGIRDPEEFSRLVHDCAGLAL